MLQKHVTLYLNGSPPLCDYIPFLPRRPTAGWESIPELLEAFRTEFALRLLWGQSGAAADRQERYDKFDKILCVLSDKLEPVELIPERHDPVA